MTRRIAYRVAIPAPHTHLVEVEGRVDGVTETAELVMPSWTPGSYLLREFPRNVQEFGAFSGSGAPLAFAKTDKNTWRVSAPSDGVLIWRYRVYANELTVRTSHVDASHASLNGASIFCFLRGRERDPIEVRVEGPPGWSIACGLPGEERGELCAESYAHLIDSPIEVGTHDVIPFDVDGVPHRYVIWGSGSYEADRLVRDTTEIVRAARRMWGSLPFDQYTFLLHLVPAGRGGLEHRSSTLLQAARTAFQGADYENFLGLVAHEFFHVWNGALIRPEPLVEPDLTREAYTRNLWVTEGLTTYYTELLLVRAGLISEDRAIGRLSELVQRYLSSPGRRVQSLADSSFDAWIKFYRQDEHSPNAQISYYLKGALVGLLLDMRIREATDSARSLDDFMRLLLERYAARGIGIPEHLVEGILPAANKVAGTDLGDQLESWIFGVSDLELEPALAVVGLRLDETAGPAATPAGEIPVFGCKVETSGGRTVVAHVLTGSPAEAAGLNARDELVAIDDVRVEAGSVVTRARSATPGERLGLTVSRRGELRELELVPRPAPPKPRIVRDGSATRAQLEARKAWLAGSKD